MPESAKEPTPSALDDLERDADAAIAACGGDMRETIKSLLVANSFLEKKVDRLIAVTSAGYARGKLGKPPQ